MRFPLRWKLALITAIPMALVAIAVGALVYRSLCLRSAEEFDTRSQRLNAAIAAQLDGHLARAAQVARCTAAFVAANPDLSRSQIERTLLAAMDQEPLIYGVAVAFEPHAFHPSTRLVAPYAVRRGGQVHLMDIGSEAYDYTDPKWEWYRVPRESGAPAWTEPYFDQGAGDALLCTYGVPISRDGRVIGVATIDVPVAELQSRLTAALRPTEQLFVLSPRGTFVSAPDPSLIQRRSMRAIAEERNDEELRRLVKIMLSGKRGIVLADGVLPGPGGIEPTWYFFEPVPTTGWALLVTVPQRASIGREERDFQRSVPTLALGLLAVSGCIFVAARRFTRPIEDLTRAVRSMASGAFEEVVVPKVRSNDEIGQLAASVETTLAELRSRVPVMIRTQVEEQVRTRVEEKVELEVSRRLVDEARRAGRRGVGASHVEEISGEAAPSDAAATPASRSGQRHLLRRGGDVEGARETGVLLDSVARRDGVQLVVALEADGAGLEAVGAAHSAVRLLRGLFGSTSDAARILGEAERLASGLGWAMSVGVVVYRPKEGTAEIALAGEACAWLITGATDARRVGTSGQAIGRRSESTTAPRAKPGESAPRAVRVPLEIGDQLLIAAHPLGDPIRAVRTGFGGHRAGTAPWWLLQRTG